MASGNLPYNQAQLARKGLGLYLAIELTALTKGYGCFRYALESSRFWREKNRILFSGYGAFLGLLKIHKTHI